MSSKSRNRGRILTPEGLGRLQQAIRAWELENEMRCTQEKLRELTIAEKPPNGLDPGTISKILEAEKGVDPKSIRCLFKTLGLELDEADLVASSRSQLQVDSNFVGREGAIADLSALVNRGVKVIVIHARGGVGKTTLARKYLQQEFDSFLEFPIAKETKDIASIESLIEEKLRQLGEEPGREFFVSLDRLKRKLQNERTGILIDNLEPALDSAGKFIEPHRRYVELLRVLADPSVQSVTLITTRERLRESSITIENYILRSLDLTAWEQFFQSRNLSTDTLDFAALHNAYGGNAKAMDIIRSAILEDYAGDITAYWQANQHDLFIERDLEDLVTQQFDRLQQIDADAYNLLCRMGCYRYQDVPTVPIEGLLCLLWDVPENRQRRVVKSLQDRSLIEFQNGEFWLHPVIRSEAIDRLEKNKDRDISHQNAASFWRSKIKTINTVEDVLTAFESYFHYLEIKDFETAGETIIERRENSLRQKLSLGDSFCRLGLVQQISSNINRIIRFLKIKENQYSLYHTLANAEWIVGNIHQAISYQKIVMDGFSQILKLSKEGNFNLSKSNPAKKAIFYSLLSMGIYKIDLWELEEAFSIFEEIVGNVLPNDYLYTKAICYLAFIASHLGAREKAILLAEEAYRMLTKVTEFDGSFTYHSQFLALSYRELGDIPKSFEIYQKTLLHLNKTGQVQSRAKALSGIASLYRDWKEFELAIEYHLEAIDLLKSLGAKCDLAETCYQIGLTYQTMGEHEKSNENFQEAIRLFSEMEAPKQVERVRRSMTHSEQLE